MVSGSQKAKREGLRLLNQAQCHFHQSETGGQLIFKRKESNGLHLLVEGMTCAHQEGRHC